MKRILLMMVALAWAGCGQDERALERDLPPAENDLPPVPSKTELQARKQLALVTVNEAVQGFRVLQRRYPGSLSELIEVGLLAELPELPETMRFTYDPAEGAVGIAEDESDGKEQPE